MHQLIQKNETKKIEQLCTSACMFPRIPPTCTGACELCTSAWQLCTGTNICLSTNAPIQRVMHWFKNNPGKHVQVQDSYVAITKIPL
jgi:hypothetical protein